MAMSAGDVRALTDNIQKGFRGLSTKKAAVGEDCCLAVLLLQHVQFKRFSFSVFSFFSLLSSLFSPL